ncbi:MAG TPA: RDD family protein [Longimicrobiales bacterium]|nr:RDD family protein [Longimicrobiales bacterium]
MVADLRSHLADRLETAGSESALVAELDPPAEYAAALVADHRYEPAPHGRRVMAFLIDLSLGVPLVAGAVVASHGIMLLFAPAWPNDMLQLWWSMVAGAAGASLLFLLAMLAGALAVSALILSVVYFPAAEAVWGTTVGKKLMGLRVVAENGTRVTWLKAIMRRIPFYFEFFLLDALFALFTERRQRAFDVVSRTLVVRQP